MIPQTYLAVFNHENFYKSQYNWEYFHVPIIFEPSEYQKGKYLILNVDQTWDGSPARDFTVKVYWAVPEGDAKLFNYDIFTNMIHMDGSEPSGFLDSDYRTGEVHEAYNAPLRCFYYYHDTEETFDVCSLYECPKNENQVYMCLFDVNAQARNCQC